METKKEKVILVKDSGDYGDFEYIYGVLILSGDTLDLRLLQNRLDKEREKLGYEDYNGEDIIKIVLKKYTEDYKDLRYISYNDYNVEV